MARHGRRSLSSRVCRRKKWPHKRRCGRRLSRFFRGIGAKAAITGLDYNDVPAHVLYEDKLCIIQANVCGIRQRLPLLQGRAQSADASVIVACETKIDGTVEAGSLAIKGYTLISRKDRSAHGGGILVWAKTSLNATEIDTADVAEASWILVATVMGNVCICCCYRPPGSTAVDAYLPRSLGKVTIFDPIVTLLVGDFNRHDLDSLYTSTRSLGLKQLIREPTHVRGGVLDMVFTNSDGGCVMTSVDPIEARISDHVCITTTIPLLLSTNSSKATRRGWDFRHADWKGFRAYVHRKLRRRLLSGGCPDRAVSHLESVLHSGMEIFIKAVDIPTGCNSVPWWDNACTDAVASLVRDPTADSRRVALGLIEAKRHEYCDMVREKLTEGRLSCKQFHRLAKELSLSTKAKSCSIPPLELADGVLTTDDSAKAEALAQHFQSKMVLPDSDGPFDAGPRVLDSASTTSLLVDPCDVMSILKRLNVSKAAGPSCIGPRVFRELASVLAPPLASLYNNIFRRCQWPRSWKISNICPIYKRKSRRDVRNYRPIALLEIPSRIFERIFSQKLVTHALKNNVIAPDQAAFLPGRGTGDVMWEFVSDAISAMNSRQTWHVLQTDIAGAFDRVDRALLLRRLENAGIRGRLCNLLQNYLSDRKFKVVCAGTCSTLYHESAGVCQGSCLGPILWLYYFSPIHSAATRAAGPGLTTYTFADDHTQGSRVRAQLDQGEVGALVFTGGARITMESSKKVLSSFANRCRTPANVCPVLLGLGVDSALTMSSHFDHALKQVSIRTAQLLRLRSLLDTSQLARCYKQYCWPFLEYGMPGFIHASEAQLRRLDSCQDRFVELTGCSLPSLGWRRHVGMMCWLYKIVVLKRGSPSLQARFVVTTSRGGYNTRLKSRLHPYQLAVAKRQNDLAIYRRWCRVLDSWNSLPPYVFPEEHNRLESFKHAVSLLDLFL